MLKDYISKIFKVSQQGDAREESYYPVLKELLENFAEEIGKKNIQVTVQPKKSEGGNPDFRIWDGKEEVVGYIEAKDPSELHLDEIETTGQLKRYLDVWPNVILTNFHEFRLYRNGVQTDRVLISRPLIAHKLKVVPPVEKEKEFHNLLEKFFSFTFPAIKDAKTLAEELAKRTQLLHDYVIAEVLKTEKGHLHGFYEAFQKFLIGRPDQGGFCRPVFANRHLRAFCR